MKLKDTVRYAEIISSIAVVATLLFLIFEIRQNSDLVRISMFESQTDALMIWRQSLAENQESRELYFRFIRGDVEPLTELETNHLALILNTLWSTYERAFLAHSRELLGEEEWQRFQGQICFQYSTDPEYWANNVSRFLIDDFRRYVEANCSSDA